MQIHEVQTYCYCLPRLGKWMKSFQVRIEREDNGGHWLFSLPASGGFLSCLPFVTLFSAQFFCLQREAFLPPFLKCVFLKRSNLAPFFISKDKLFALPVSGASANLEKSHPISNIVSYYFHKMTSLKSQDLCLDLCSQ